MQHGLGAAIQNELQQLNNIEQHIVQHVDDQFARFRAYLNNVRIRSRNSARVDEPWLPLQKTVCDPAVHLEL